MSEKNTRKVEFEVSYRNKEGQLTISEHFAYITDCPGTGQQDIENYILYGSPLCGDFLFNLFCNRLVETFAHADGENTKLMEQWSKYLFNYVPCDCYGSEKQVEAWIKKGGLVGHYKESLQAMVESGA